MSAIAASLTAEDLTSAIIWAEDAIREDQHTLNMLGDCASASYASCLQKRIAKRREQIERFRSALIQVRGA
ncbi:hypothetical protein XSP_001043 [Xanthomonas euroxanthea]|uniref:Uncharacterized protein n=1 Tax=Xanthomonas euroxanthea TaxID=2259622 RepID=A0A8E4EKW8_9XANT|nr:hypothetical protein [Xanthomonas euroxanthea]CAD1788735.1 hypothetical protein XSP_001043 [Xanthomonas euroxanthea]SYZ52244.1 hypothetical protein CPBF367_10480 [Xanthomonas arboricola pv. juglandis]